MVLEDKSLGRCLYHMIKALKGTITAITEVHGNLSASGCIKIVGEVTMSSQKLHYASTLMYSSLEHLEGEN